MPSMPYFELPAGLMVPLIKLEDGEYKPLDPDAIRLPPPAPPSDRLVAAVEAFYAPPNHDSPRDRSVSHVARLRDVRAKTLVRIAFYNVRSRLCLQ